MTEDSIVSHFSSTGMPVKSNADIEKFIKKMDKNAEKIPCEFFLLISLQIYIYQTRGSVSGFVTLTSSPLGSITKSPFFKA